MSEIEQAAQEDIQQVITEEVAPSADEATASVAPAGDAAPSADGEEPAREIRLRSLDVVTHSIQKQG